MKYLIFVFVALFFIGCQENEFSDEMMEQFWLLDKTIAISSKKLVENTEYLILEMDKTAKIQVQDIPLIFKAREIQNIRAEFNSYIDILILQLAIESGGAYTKEMAEKLGKPELEGRPIGQNDKKIPDQIFLSRNEPQGEFLYQKIQKLRDIYIDTIAKIWDNGGIEKTIFADSSKKINAIEKLRKELIINGIDDYNPSRHDNKTWAEFTFADKPVLAIYPILRKLQNDAVLLESAVVHFLRSQQVVTSTTDARNMVFVTTYPSKPNVRLGETYEAKITLVELLSQADLSVYVNNENIKVKNGFATYKVKPNSIGEKKYTAKIVLGNPLTGETHDFVQDFYYQVVGE